MNTIQGAFSECTIIGPIVDQSNAKNLNNGQEKVHREDLRWFLILLVVELLESQDGSWFL